MEMSRFNEEENPKLVRWQERWLDGKLWDMQRAINKEMYKPGGAFDQYAGDDNILSYDEMVKMDQELSAHMS